MASKKPFQMLTSLMSNQGEAYTPPEGPRAGPAIQQWGRTQANNQRFQDATNWLQNMGKPGTGFLRPQHASPLPSPWEILGHVIKGRSNAIEASGGKANIEDYHAGAGSDRPTTRFDPLQVGVTTGQTLADDQQGFERSANTMSSISRNALLNLRRKYGLIGAQ